MGVADNLFNDEEAKYFESRGRDIPEAESSEDSGRAGGDELAARDEPVVSEQPDGEHDEAGGEARHTGEVQSSSENEPAGASDGEEQPKRDFEKAYHSERHKRVEMRDRLAEVERQNQEIRKYLEGLNAEKQQPKVEAPDINEDPVGYQQHQMQQLESRVNSQQQILEKQAKQATETSNFEQFKSAYKQSAAEFVKEKPDFVDAYRHLIESKVSEYKNAGYNQQQIDYIIEQQEADVVIKAYQDGVNPAERIYAVAASRGYVKTPPKPQGASHLENVEKGVKKAKGLPNSTASSIGDRLDMNNIDNMDDKEFAAFFNKVKRQQKKEERPSRGW